MKDPIADSLRDLTKKDLQSESGKVGRIEVRVSMEEKREIKEISEQVGLSVAEYFLSLHRFARVRLRKTK